MIRVNVKRGQGVRYGGLTDDPYVVCPPGSSFFSSAKIGAGCRFGKGQTELKVTRTRPRAEEKEWKKEWEKSLLQNRHGILNLSSFKRKLWSIRQADSIGKLLERGNSKKTVQNKKIGRKDN